MDTKIAKAGAGARHPAASLRDIVRLIGQVITVSLETVKVVRLLPPLGLEHSHTVDIMPAHK